MKTPQREHDIKNSQENITCLAKGCSAKTTNVGGNMFPQILFWLLLLQRRFQPQYKVSLFRREQFKATRRPPNRVPVIAFYFLGINKFSSHIIFQDNLNEHVNNEE